NARRRPEANSAAGGGGGAQPAARVTRRLAPQSEQSAYSRTKPTACVVFAAARYAVEGSMPIARAAHASQRLCPPRATRKAARRCFAVAGVMARRRSSYSGRADAAAATAG